MLLARPTRFKHTPVDNLNFTHWLKFLCEVLKELSREENKLRSVGLVHFESCCPGVEPHTVYNLGHVL